MYIHAFYSYALSIGICWLKLNSVMRNLFTEIRKIYILCGQLHCLSYCRQVQFTSLDIVFTNVKPGIRDINKLTLFNIPDSFRCIQFTPGSLER